ncbi:MAG: hypothetical protein NZV14_10470 [Bryobacteraceae bacterium]|nr:hypothetical protein [Bryobacteraceae bacterium]MDW8378577.1 hypothetical protein [Bryobacterales bacterium]
MTVRSTDIESMASFGRFLFRFFATAAAIALFAGLLAALLVALLLR